MPAHDLPRFVRGDLDGFFGLMIDNLMQLIVIVALCTGLCGMTAPFVISHVLPGAAVSVLFGNLFYARQARKIARARGLPETTALPYGINTVSLFAYVLFIMRPVYEAARAGGAGQEAAAMLSWSMGLAACFLSGIIEFLGAFVAERIRKNTPRAALLSTLSGIAIAFIAMDFAFRIYSHPLVALLPLAVILIQYFGRIPFPYKIPGGLLAVLVGTLLAWAPKTGFMQWQPAEVALCLPKSSLGALFSTLFGRDIWRYFSIIFPMGLFNVIGSLQNIESAEAGGDRFDTKSSLMANGIGTVVASCFGSCFPTTIYIGHPGWKALGARTAYSVINGAFIFIICVFGVMGLINTLIPIEAGAAIVFWIGIVITAQAFQAVPGRHAPAVAIGLFPAIAAWGLFVADQALAAAGTSIGAVMESGGFAFTGLSGIRGMIALERGFMFTCMIVASVSVYLIDKDLIKAGVWGLIGAVLSFFGIIHAFSIAGGAVVFKLGFNEAPGFTVAYLLMATLFFGMAAYLKRRRGPL
jgi:AGZA family xanthine/uracil permease-like MFS transporter